MADDAKTSSHTGNVEKATGGTRESELVQSDDC